MSASKPIRLSRPQLKRRLEAVGGDFEIDDVGDITADAPPGYTWASNGCTVIVQGTRDLGGRSYLAEAMDELCASIAHGLRKCTPAESEEFEHLRDEPWSAAEDAPEFIDGLAILKGAGQGV